MNILISEVRTNSVWFNRDDIWLRFKDGRQISAPLAFYLGCFMRQKNNAKILN